MDKGRFAPNPNNPPHRTAAQRGKTNFARLTKTGHDLREAARHSRQPALPLYVEHAEILFQNSVKWEVFQAFNRIICIC